MGPQKTEGMHHLEHTVLNIPQMNRFFTYVTAQYRLYVFIPTFLPATSAVRLLHSSPCWRSCRPRMVQTVDVLPGVRPSTTTFSSAHTQPGRQEHNTLTEITNWNIALKGNTAHRVLPRESKVAYSLILTHMDVGGFPVTAQAFFW